MFNIGTENRKTYVFFTNPNASLKSGQLKYVYPGSTSLYKIEQSLVQKITGCNDLNYPVEMYNSAMSESFNVSGDFDTCREFASQVLFVRKCGCQNPFLPIYRLSASPAKLCLNMSLYDDAAIKKNVDCLSKTRDKYSQENRFTKVMEKV